LFTSLVPWVVAAAVVSALFLFSGFVRYIPNNRVGILEKRVSARGSVKSGFIAMNGEAGFQPHVLRGGWHVFTPFQYRIHIVPLVTIPQGKIGYVFARDGQPLKPTQTLASNVTANDFQDVAHFLRNGGQRGPQRQIVREGTYAINLVQFVVLTDSQLFYLPLERNDDETFKRMASMIAERQGFTPVVIKGADDLVGITTVHDGPSLPQGEIIAPTVGDDPRQVETYHNNFQDIEHFLRAGGRRGRQLQVLVEGTYYVNRLFATVEPIPKTVIEVGNVGVVVSYTGEEGTDLSGVEYKHGEMVSSGKRGVWSAPLLPGKYAFNTYAGKVIVVPTTNVILKWIRNQVGSHKLDENLSEVGLITKDAFEPSLPLSVVMHIDYKKAPLVIQRFGDIKRLVEQTLDPMVSAYFKNIGQTRTLIQLIQDRSVIQDLSSEQMKEKFAHYNLELEEVLIGTPTSGEGGQIEQILMQLRSRQIATEQVETYTRQETAAVKERELREAEARAKQQTVMTESEIAITVQSNQGKAEYQRSLQQAATIQALAEAEGRKVRIMADAEAGKIKAIGEAEADKTARVGVAEAVAIDEQVKAYGGPKFRVTQEVMSRLAQAIEVARVDVVPKIVIGGQGPDGAGSTSSIFQALLTMLLSDKVGVDVKTSTTSTVSAEVQDLAQQFRQAVTGRPAKSGTSPGAHG
jgi:uncharacterized membrane protein YqiK